ncbi:MAG: hypothetical protein WCD31_08545 [Gillisia sp.]
MKISRTHIPDKILKARDRRIKEQELLQEVREIFRTEEAREERIKQAMLTDEKEDFYNLFNLDLLETKRIYHISDIEKICIQYRLRFLDTSLYKGDLPFEAVSKIKLLEKQHQVELKGFKIMAPASLFRLKNADDPLLFAPMGNDYYYLVHSWGKDLHPLRKILMWPFRDLENFIVLLVALSFAFTTMVPEGLFTEHATTAEFLMIFFFMFKWVAGIALFVGFKKGKNFSAAIWRSQYFNA